ncbi:MBL fold metallo-hydrolase [bacterium]|nr:MBL fold metallo-hydrolase [bacterium]
MTNPGVKISRILHAGYLFEKENTQIAFDPIFENPFSKNCYAFPSAQFNRKAIQKLSLSAVFISHHHDDHCSIESLALLDRNTPIYIYCHFEELLDWIRQLGFTNIFHLQLNKPVIVGEFSVTPLQALDADVDCLFHINVAGLNILNVVDSWIDDQTKMYLKGISSWTMILWPFQIMREVEVLSPHRLQTPSIDFPEEWSEQFKSLQPRFVVPSSCQFIHEEWSWYRKSFFSMSYKKFSKWIKDILSQTEVVRLNPGVSVLLTENSISFDKPLDWIIPVGEQNVDYEFDPDQKPLTTSEVARYFSPLTEEQKKIVFDFCENKILERYKLIGPPQDVYFQKKRCWRLSLFDHNDSPHHLFYEIQDEQMRQVESVAGENLGWVTEVPINTLYGALELGETLSSMYLRINPETFDNVTEQELVTVDLLEDPLVRTLFNGIFCAYQKAQLQRILQNS